MVRSNHHRCQTCAWNHLRRTGELRARWADAGQGADIIHQLAERGIDFASVAAQAGQPAADPFDLLCHVGFPHDALDEASARSRILTRRRHLDRVAQASSPASCRTVAVRGARTREAAKENTGGETPPELAAGTAALRRRLLPEAREILDDLLEKYASDGELQLVAVRKHLRDVLELAPISGHGNVNEIAGRFGGVAQLRKAVQQLQTLLYATA
jgi:type I restriction enzyme R subunit